MAAEPVVQRSGAEVANAPAEVISEWLHEGALADLMDGNDPGKPDPIQDPMTVSGARRRATGRTPPPWAYLAARLLERSPEPRGRR